MKSNLDKHLKTHLNFKCNKCEKEFNQQFDLNRHLKSHYQENKYSCPECKKQFAFQSQLDFHLKQSHMAKRTFACLECGLNFTTETHLKRHADSHTKSTSLCCDKCGKEFTRTTPLKRHLQEDHGKQKFSCNECDTSFSRSERLVIHKKSHKDIDMYQCDDCNSCFLTKLLLDKHREKHEKNNQVTCDVCNQSFKGKHGLSIHQRVHYKKSTINNKRYVSNVTKKAAIPVQTVSGENLNSNIRILNTLQASDSSSTTCRPVEFVNESNDCYVNAALNALLSSQNILNKIKYSKADTFEVNILQNIIQGKGVQSIQRILKQIDIYFDNVFQRDSHEFFTKLINNIGESIPEIFPMFTIYTDSVRECQTCKDQQIDKTSNFFLHLPIDLDNTDIQSIVDNYYLPQKADGVICNNNCKIESEPSIILRKEKVNDPPKVLFFQLLRFGNDQQKKHHIVKPSPVINFHGSSYKIRSYIRHKGQTSTTGHYTAMLYLNNKWVECDDKIINHNPEMNDKEGYLYVYELSTDSISVSTPQQIKNATSKTQYIPPSKKSIQITEHDNNSKTIKRKNVQNNLTNSSKKLKDSTFSVESQIPQNEHEHNLSKDSNNSNVNNTKMQRPKRKNINQKSESSSKKTKHGNFIETSSEIDMETNSQSENHQQQKPNEPCTTDNSEDQNDTPVYIENQSNIPLNSTFSEQNSSSHHQTRNTEELTESEKLYLIRQENYMHLQEGDFTYDDFKDNPVLEANLKSDEVLNNLKLSDKCKICMETWYDLHIGPRNEMCTRCSNENKNKKTI